MATDNTKLKGIYDLSDFTLNDQIEDNIIMFFNWGLLQIGAFSTVRYHKTTPVGKDMSRLRPVEDPNYQRGQVWEAFKNDWVWESGVEFAYQPIQVSGVYINGTFYSGNHPTYGHKVNYPLGRILFNSVLPLNTVVNVEYTYRNYTFQSADVPWFRQIMFNAFSVTEDNFQLYGSGVWSVLSEDRVQLPAIIVETVPKRTFKPMALGGGQIIYQDVMFHVFTENPWDRKKIIDAISLQNDKTIVMFDKNIMASQDRYPLDYYGSVNQGAITYPVMVLPSGQGGFAWKKLRFMGMTTSESVAAPPLYQAAVRATCEIYFGEI
jgi:hypothetical protein